MAGETAQVVGILEWSECFSFLRIPARYDVLGLINSGQ